MWRHDDGEAGPSSNEALHPTRKFYSKVNSVGTHQMELSFDVYRHQFNLKEAFLSLLGVEIFI